MSLRRFTLLQALVVSLLLLFPEVSLSYGRDGYNFLQNKYRKPTILDKRVEAHRLRTPQPAGEVEDEGVSRGGSIDRHAPTHVKSKLLHKISFPTHTNRDRKHPNHPISMIEGNKFLGSLFAKASDLGDHKGFDVIEGKISITGENLPIVLLAIEEMAKEKGVTFYEMYKELLPLRNKDEDDVHVDKKKMKE